MSRKYGSIVEYADQRIQALLHEYYDYIKNCSHIFMPDLFDYIVNRPAPRFWVSHSRALFVIRAMMTDKDALAYMRQSKAEMFREIFKRVNKLMEKDNSLSLSDAVSIVIESPAPKFYLAPGSAKIMIYSAKKYDKRRY